MDDIWEKQLFTTPEFTALLFTFKALNEEHPEIELFSLSVEFPIDDEAAEAADAAAASVAASSMMLAPQ